MMKAAERDEIVELRLTALRPMLDVVPVAKARSVATGKAAAAVTGTQRACDGRRDGASLAADVEGPAVLAFDEADYVRITGESSSGVERERGSVLELASMRAALGG